jgi:hypothetical protein
VTNDLKKKKAERQSTVNMVISKTLLAPVKSILTLSIEINSNATRYSTFIVLFVRNFLSIF